ncbi:MAG: phosphoglucosamine mutase [Saprospiraceae bacterium]
MTLIKSISGIRGTIGGKAGDNFTPIDIVECTAAFGQWTLDKSGIARVVVGRDARISGKLVQELVIQTLLALGIDVIDLDLSTTPTVEMAVTEENAGAGIIITASHNPAQWNALKFLNDRGEFISATDGAEVLDYIAKRKMDFVGIDQMGTRERKDDAIEKHIAAILSLPLIPVGEIKKRKFKIVLDPVNSTGSLALPPLLEKLGCTVHLIHGDPTGHFAHNPEPLPHHLTDLSQAVIDQHADLGISVDPDVDRLALVCPDGSMFGEEYTLVAVADYILGHTPGATVSNVSSSLALKDVTETHGQTYYAAAVGEVNVVTKMKKVNAVIGGEGNGGIIYPGLHYGRDALVGIAFILALLTERNTDLNTLKSTYPPYEMVKDRIELDDNLDKSKVLQKVRDHFAEEKVNEIDGIKIEWPDRWVQIRASNTEPILRVYAEAPNQPAAQTLVDEVKKVLS